MLTKAQRAWNTEAAPGLSKHRSYWQAALPMSLVPGTLYAAGLPMEGGTDGSHVVTCFAVAA